MVIEQMKTRRANERNDVGRNGSRTVRVDIRSHSSHSACFNGKAKRKAKPKKRGEGERQREEKNTKKEEGCCCFVAISMEIEHFES